MFEFTVRDREGKKALVRVDLPEVVVGRKAPADLVLPDRAVSGAHARISTSNGRIVVEDLHSHNGVYVTGERVEGAAEVDPGDIITIGPYQIWARVVRGGKAGAPRERRGASPSSPQDVAEAGRADETGTTEPAKPPPGKPRKAIAYGEAEAEFYSYLTLFLEPIRPFLDDPTVQEILVNGHTEIYVERAGRLIPTDAQFESEEQVRSAAQNIARYVGRRLDEKEPILDARLPDGSRVHVVLPPCSRRGTLIAIRKFQSARLTVDWLVEHECLSAAAARTLEAAILLRKNILVSGGTGSGKTSLLNALSAFIPESERIAIIEDASELQLKQPHILPLETRPPDKHGKGQVTQRDLLKSCLRLRPDRIVFGEVRGGEALDLLQAFNTGHTGSLSTIHANSPRDALYRLETLTLYSGLELPIRAVKDQIASAIDLVIQVARFHDGSRRTAYLTEVLGLDPDGGYRVADLFRFDRRRTSQPGVVEGSLVPTGTLPSFLEEARQAGLDLPASSFAAPRPTRPNK